MLEKIIQKNTEKSKISEQLKGLREQLTLLENKIKTAGVPVIITFDGWSAAGKGSMIAKLIRSLLQGGVISCAKRAGKAYAMAVALLAKPAEKR